MIPLRFLPHVYSLPSMVIPADMDFFASISTKFMFLIICGRDELLSDPNPNSPFLPKPQDHT
jgi:hypothetical protein